MTSLRPSAYSCALVLLLLVSTGSGCAALIYEIVWFQQLELVIGSSAISTAVLLGTFMGGMGLGNLLLADRAGVRRHPMLVYAALEVGIGCWAIVVWLALPAIGRFYFQANSLGQFDYVARALICSVLLLPPTMLMGATLPVIARWTRTTPRGVSWLGACYAVNLAGAVSGCLVAGFYLLRLHNVFVASAAAVGINLGTALLAAAFAHYFPQAAIPGESPSGASVPDTSRAAVYAAISLSGFCALAAQVTWTRLLSLLLGGTVYTFSIILAVFLVGLALGGLAGAARARVTRNPRNAFGWCQLLLVLAIVWADDLLTRTLPFLAADDSAETGFSGHAGADLLRAGCAILPATIAWGASVPLALAAAAGAGADSSSRIVGRTYAANTGGAVLGAVCASLILIPWLGVSHVEAVLIAGSALAALLLTRPATLVGKCGLAAALGFAVWFGSKPSPIPWQLVAYGRHAAVGDQDARVLYLGEGAHATVAVTENAAGIRYFHVSGKTEASSEFHDMRLQRMLGHLPALIHPRPRTILVVGMGAGVTAGSFTLHPSVERIVICEVEPLVVRHVAGFFAKENNQLLDDPRVEIVLDDARHYLATTREKFDIITTDPIHPWVKGSAKLYSQEYLALCREHLNPGGLVTQWVPFYQSSREAVQCELATFFRVFPEAMVWGNAIEGKGYDSVLVGTANAVQVNVAALQTRLARPDHTGIRRNLADVQLFPLDELLAEYAGCAGDLRAWLANAEINDDQSLRLQYLAGLSVSSHTGALAFGEMLRFRRFPEQLFRGDEATIRPLRQRIEKPLVP